MIRTPEDMLDDKARSLQELAARFSESGMFAGDFYESQMHADNRARDAGEPPVLDTWQREYVIRIVGERPRTPEQREQARIAAQDTQLALDEAARRWKQFIGVPANVDKLIALVEQAPTPEPTVAPWLRKP